MRQIVLDTETTGLEPSQGHRLIEIGCVEMVDRKLTRRNFHYYLNPDREIEDGAFEVHGISNEFLADKPRFEEIAADFIEYIKGAELIIHNAAFDVGFLNHELALLEEKLGLVEDHAAVLDTLALARSRHPGQKNNLDALCKRYAIDNSQRTLHGALLDAEILADVYLAMTGGQTMLSLGSRFMEGNQEEEIQRLPSDRPSLPVIPASDDELQAHRDFLARLNEESDNGALWSRLHTDTAD